jgi:hypothetical protein
LQDGINYLQWCSASPKMLCQAMWLSIPPLQHFSYLSAPA